MEAALGPGFETVNWAEIMGFGRNMTLLNGRIATGTVHHHDLGDNTKALCHLGPSNSGRGIGFAGADAPRRCELTYVNGDAVLGTNLGFLSEEHGGTPGLKHYSVPGDTPAILLVLRFRRRGGGDVTVADHPNVAAMLTAQQLRAAPPLFDFGPGGRVLADFRGWCIAPDDTATARPPSRAAPCACFLHCFTRSTLCAATQAQAISSALHRGAAAETAGFLTTLVRNKIMEAIIALTPQQCVLSIHAIDFVGCCVANCTDAEHGRAHRRSLHLKKSPDSPVMYWKAFFAVTGISAAFSGSTFEQLRSCAFGGDGPSQEFYVRAYAVLSARITVLELQNPSPSSLRAAAAAAAAPIPERPATCTFTPCTKPVVDKRVFEPHKEITRETRFLYCCDTHKGYVEKGKLVVTWTDPPTWEYLVGKNSADHAPSELSAPFVLPYPNVCMMTPCTNTMMGVNKGYGYKVYQFPEGNDRNRFPRYLWCCNACRCKNGRKPFKVDWTQFPPVVRP